MAFNKWTRKFCVKVSPFLLIYAKLIPQGPLSSSLILVILFLINFLLSRRSYSNTSTSYFVLSEIVRDINYSTETVP